MEIKTNDWHQADIIAALRKQGTSLAELSRQSGFSSSTLSNALVRPWTKGEKIIASALNLSPNQIWPSRYINPKTKKPIKRILRINKMNIEKPTKSTNKKL